jgi:hypothetical protein
LPSGSRGRYRIVTRALAEALEEVVLAARAVESSRQDDRSNEMNRLRARLEFLAPLYPERLEGGSPAVEDE